MIGITYVPFCDELSANDVFLKNELSQFNEFYMFTYYMSMTTKCTKMIDGMNKYT